MSIYKLSQPNDLINIIDETAAEIAKEDMALAPCPNEKCEFRKAIDVHLQKDVFTPIGAAVDRFRYTCSCGFSAPWAFSKEKARALWNAVAEKKYTFQETLKFHDQGVKAMLEVSQKSSKKDRALAERVRELIRKTQLVLRPEPQGNGLFISTTQ